MFEYIIYRLYRGEWGNVNGSNNMCKMKQIENMHKSSYIASSSNIYTVKKAVSLMCEIQKPSFHLKNLCFELMTDFRCFMLQARLNNRSDSNDSSNSI